MPKVKRSLERFAKTTTAHGFIQLVDWTELNICEKSLWIFVVIGTIVGLITHLSLQTISYLNYEKSITIQTIKNTTNFPSVVICLPNIWTWSRLKDSLQTTNQIKGLRQSLYDAIGNITSRHAAVYKRQFADKIIKSHALTYSMNSQHDLQFLKVYLPKIHDVLIRCRYQGKKCDEKWFSQLYAPDHGACFTFKGRNKTKAHINYNLGLELLLYLPNNQYESNNYDAYPVGYQKSAAIFLKNNKTYINLHRASPILAPTGKLTNVAVYYSEIHRISTPKEPCISTKKHLDLKTMKVEKYKYDRINCLDEHLNEHMLQDCGCVDISFPMHVDEAKDLDPKKYCQRQSHVTPNKSYILNAKQLIEDYKCQESVLLDDDNIHSLQDEHTREHNVCHEACDDIIIHRELSQTDIYHAEDKAAYDYFKDKIVHREDVEEGHADHDEDSELHLLTELLHDNGNYTYKNASDLKNSLIHVNIYIKTNTRTVYNEQLALGITTFFSEVGGLIGLWVGASLITAVEIIYLCSQITMIMWKRCLRARRMEGHMIETGNNKIGNIKGKEQCKSEKQ